jgi:hypothetical protein
MDVKEVSKALKELKQDRKDHPVFQKLLLHSSLKTLENRHSRFCLERRSVLSLGLTIYPNALDSKRVSFFRSPLGRHRQPVVYPVPVYRVEQARIIAGGLTLNHPGFRVRLFLNLLLHIPQPEVIAGRIIFV